MASSYNRDKETQFTSTGEKILAHPEAVARLRHDRRAFPIVMHIMPTEKCNLRCEFCSVANRDILPDLPFETISGALQEMIERGLKAIILSGGGDPTLYPRINDLLAHVYACGLEVGMITNGLALVERIRAEHIRRLKWLRISANTLDYRTDFELPDLTGSDGTVGFSYIWNPRSDAGWSRVQTKIAAAQKQFPVAYVRLLPDCNLPTDRLEAAHRDLRRLAARLGPPYFHQYKIHKTPPECHLGRVHPVLYTDGMVYPCDSLVLNSPGDNKKFHRDYALCQAGEIGSFYDRPIDGSLVDTARLCPCCVFERQNLLLATILNGDQAPAGQDPACFTHVNFI